VKSTPKDPIQKRIELIALALWASFCIISLPLNSKFALGVLLGGLVCLSNYQMLWRQVKSSVILTANQGSASYMLKRYFLRLALTGVVLYVLIAVLQVDTLGLLLGLSVIMLGVMSYACYTYICAGGD
jgi:peptidoglycan biosynthesis protein MviN/MurJ (putative lipid II flippase)